MLMFLRTLITGGLLLLVSPSTVYSVSARPPIFYAHSGTAVAVGDRIIGRWYFPKRESDIEIYRENGRYFAKIVAVSQATTAEYGSMTNKMLLTDLTFSRNEWAGGQLIHPQTGSHFDVFLRLADANTLIVTAYKGCRLFNKAYTLIRI